MLMRKNKPEILFHSIIQHVQFSFIVSWRILSMKNLFTEIKTRSNIARYHPFFSDIQKIEPESAPGIMKLWAPLFLHLTMTFRDVNQLFYITRPPRNSYDESINAHADVDSTHWQLLLDDLKIIGIDTHPQLLKAHLDLIWSDTGIPVRRYMYALVARAQGCGDSPFLRVTVMESAEATVKLFWETATLLAVRFEAVTSQRLRYFGDEHVLSETENQVDVSIFETVSLPPEVRNTALQFVNDHFDRFTEFLDAIYLITFGVAKK